MDLESEIDIYYDCDLCDQAFASGPDMQAHKLEVHMRQYNCPYCEQGFTELEILKTHVKHEHTREVEPEFLSSKESQETCDVIKKEENSNNNSTEHVCCDCNKKFSTLKGLNRHISYGHETKRVYNCPDCSKSYRSEKSLEKHIDKGHLQIEKVPLHYKCDDCGKMLQSGCLFHVCKNEVPLTCDHCGETFVNSDDFKKHRRSCYKPSYPCTECDEVFCDRLKLVYHLEIHYWKNWPETQLNEDEDKKMTIESSAQTGNPKKHKCDLCETAFARPENLKRHIQRMHKAKVIS